MQPTRFFDIQPGEVLAYVRQRGRKRELSLKPVKIQQSNNGWVGEAGSIGSPWVVVGYEFCSRPEGSRYWFSDGGLTFHSVREAVMQLAENREIADDDLLHSAVIQMRNDMRLTEDEIAAEGEADAQSEGESASESAGEAAAENA